MAQEDPTVRQWAVAAQGGDQYAFGLLVEHFQHDAYNLAYRLLGEPQEAEDAAQEAFLRAYAHLDKYDPQRSFKTWLLSITSNHCIDRLRKRRMTWVSIEDEITVTPPALISPEPTPEQAFTRQESSAALQAFMAQIPPDYRMVIVLRYWYDMSYTEIAEVVGTSESAVKSRLFRARQALGKLLEGGPEAVAMTEKNDYPGAAPASPPAMRPAMEGS